MGPFLATAPAVKADVHGLIAVPALSLSHSQSLLSTVPAFTTPLPPPFFKAEVPGFPPVAEKGRFRQCLLWTFRQENTAPVFRSQEAIVFRKLRFAFGRQQFPDGARSVPGCYVGSPEYRLCEARCLQVWTAGAAG